MSVTKPFIVCFRYLVEMLIIQYGTRGQWKPDTLNIDERFQDSRSVFNNLLLYWVQHPAAPTKGTHGKFSDVRARRGHEPTLGDIFIVGQFVQSFWLKSIQKHQKMSLFKIVQSSIIVQFITYHITVSTLSWRLVRLENAINIDVVVGPQNVNNDKS